MTKPLPKDRRIIEKGSMDYRPFGVTPKGDTIRDVSGVIVRANVEYLQEFVARSKGEEAGGQAVEELCRLLNERIRDPAYHVTPTFLKNVWHSYSYEFVCFLGEFCRDIAQDQHFQFRVGQEKFLPPPIQVLARPLSLGQIYKMFPHFGDKFAKGSIQFETRKVTARSAVLRMKFTDAVYEQFGPYRHRCAELVCQSAKAGLAAVPAQVHHQRPATIVENTCIADGAEHCEWEFRWKAQPQRDWGWAAAALLTGGAVLGYLRLRHPEVSWLEGGVLAALPTVFVWQLKILASRARLIKEQLASAELRHEELREAFTEQEQATVELRRKVRDLTTLHEVSLLLNSTMDRERLIEAALSALIRDLKYDRAMISFYDKERGVALDGRLFGVPEDVKTFIRSSEVPVTDPNSIEGTVLLREEPVLVQDLRKAWDRLHPINQRLIEMSDAKSFMSVPLKVKDRVIGALTVDRTQDHAVSDSDLDVMTTVAGQLAVALDNADAYRQIEALNVGLEDMVRVRTAQLEEANHHVQRQATQLAEWNQLLAKRVQEQVHQIERLGILKRFFSPQLSDLIVSGGAENPLKSHRQEITVVFIDLRGYTSFAETAKPEELMEMLHEYHAEMGKIVMQYHGTLERFAGDGMVIFFNDPVPVANPTEQAVRMAQAMRDGIAVLARKWDTRGYQLGFGIGIANGKATIGVIGFEGRWDYAAIGPVTNLAARLCNEAKSGQILVSHQFLQTVATIAEADPVGELSLKGFKQPITTFNIRCVKAESRQVVSRA